MKVKVALVFPPDFDGELHVEVDTAEPHAGAVVREVVVRISAPLTETVEDTLRRLGKQLMNQPMRRRRV